MWYFTVKQQDLTNMQYQSMQKLAEMTEVVIFNEPYTNFCLFEINTGQYREVMDYLDMQGIAYTLSASKPTRDQLLESMK